VPVSKNSRIQLRRKSGKAESSTQQKQGKTINTPLNAIPERHGVGKSSKTPAAGRELWIAKKTSLSRQKDAVPWSTHLPGASDARLLELADIALGLRKPQPFRRRRSLFLANHSR
jgi:hypothetical protein